MAEGGDQLSSFIVVDVDGDLKDVENEDLVKKFAMSYLEDIQRSGGGKFASGGFVKNPKSQKLQYVAHYANLKSVERVLKRHEHCIEVDKKSLVLTVRPCPPNLKKVLEKETPSSDGEGDGTGNSSNGESSPVDEGRGVAGQNSTGSSDIEVISREEADGFTFVDVTKQGSTRHTGDVPAKRKPSEIHPSVLSKDATPPHSSDSSPCSTPESFDESSIKDFDQWSRSIIIENVPQDMFSTLRLLLENKSVGGGNITTYERDPTSNDVLATFEQLEAAANFVAAEKLNVMRQVFSVRRPLLLEDTKDTSSDKDEDPASVPASEAKDKAAAAASVPEEKEDAGQRKDLENRDDEDAQLKNKVGNESENESKQSQEEPEADARKRDDEEQNRDKEEEKLAEEKREEKQPEELNKEIQNKEELQKVEEERKEDQRKDEQEEFKARTESEGQRKDDIDDIKPKESEDEEEDEQKKEGKPRRETDAAANEERTRAATSDARDSSVDEDLLNADKLSKDHHAVTDGAETTLSETSEEKPIPEAEKSTDEFVLVSTPLKMHPERKDDASLNSDTSGSGPSSSLDALKSPKSIIVQGVSSQNVDIVEIFLENRNRGGGPIKEFKFSESDGEISVIFEDELVADKFLGLESFSILENTFYVSSPEKKKMKDEKRKSPEESLESREEAEEEFRTVEVHGVGSSEVAEFIAGLMKNRRRGGGEIEKESLDEKNGILTVQFQDKKIADHFLAQKSFSMAGKSYDIHAPVKEEPKPESIPSEEDDFKDAFKDREAEERSRIVEVHGVQSQEAAETIVDLLETKRRGGGPVEENFLSESKGILTVKFRDKKYAEHFLRQEVISAFEVRYYVRPPLSSHTQPGIAIMTDQKPQDMETSDQGKSPDDDEEVPECREEHMGKLTKEPIEKVENKRDESDASEYQRKLAEEPVRRPKEEPQEESLVGDPCVIEVQGIPDNATDTVVTMLFKNKKYCGIADVEVTQVQNLEGGRALLTIKEPQHAKALIERGNISYKTHTLVISKPSKPDPVEEVKELVQHPFSRKDANETPDGNAKGHEESISELATIDVSNIPEGMAEDTLQMIFESKRFGGGGEVTNIVYGKGRRSAVITLSDPEDAKALIERGSISYKTHTLVISRPSKPDPVEEVKELVQHPFSRKDANETPDGNAKGHEESISELATIDVSNIPEGMAEDTLQMIFESKRFGGGGEVTNIVYGKGRRSAVITLSDPEVAKSLVHKEFVDFKGSKLMITKHVEEDRSQKPFPPRKRSSAPTSEREVPAIADRMIKVSNIRSDVNRDTLEMIFESKRYGGGDTENIVYHQGQGTAAITFKDPEVAKTLLQKEVLVYKSNQFSITKPVEESLKGAKQEQAPSVSSTMVDVSDIPTIMTKEMLKLFLENNSGGEIEGLDYNQELNTAVATFTDSVAADVLISDETVAHKGKRLSFTRHIEKVDEMKHIPKEKKEQPSSSSNRSIFVSQIPQTLNKDYLVMIFENKRVGGGKTEEVDYNGQNGTAVITFENSSVAASFLKKEVVEFKGQRMLVTKHEDWAADVGRSADDNENNSAKELPSTKYTASASFNTVKISGIPQNTSKEMITMYFENKKRSGGGTLAVLEYQKEKGKAVIKFDNSEDGLEVCKKPHVLSGVTLKISALEMPLDDVKSCAIEVKGLGERATVDFLELYFDNKARSGGGAVENVVVNKEARTAIVVFKEVTAVSGVMKKQSHVFDGAKLEVNVLEAAPPPPLLLSDVDTKRLLAKRLPRSATRESLSAYLSPAARAKMVGWTVAVTPSTALLDFSSEPDYLSIRRLVCSKPFLGKMISIRRVPLTSSILVTGMPASVSVDFVAMYFENPRNGGTGEECKVELLSDKGSAIVEFDRPDVIRAITSRQHLFEKKEVKVEPYYPWLGLSSASESSGKVPAKTKLEIPTSLTHTFGPVPVHFIMKRPELKKHIENSLEKSNCCIVWPSEGKGEVKLEYKGKEKQKPTSGWDVECQKVLQKYADELTWKKENVLQEIWNDFKKKIQEHIVEKSKVLDTFFENDQCEIQYIGLKKVTDEFEKIFKKIKGDLEAELERKRKRISEPVTNLKPHQLDLIRTEEFKKNLRQKLPDLEFEVKETEVNLCGMPEVVKKARLFMLERVAVAAQDSFEISEPTSRVFAKGEAKPYLMEQLHSKGISASWTCNDRSVVVYAFDNKNVKEAVEILKEEVVEVHIQLSKSSEALAQSGQWKEFIRSLCDDNKSLEVVVMGPTVVAVGTRNIVDGVQRRLNGFIEKHAVLEKSMPMDLGVVEVITKYMKDELRKIEAELKECSGSIGTSEDEPGFIIKGNETGVPKAEKDLLKLIDGIAMYDHDIDRPGIPAYFYSKHGKEVLRGIQINHKVSIQLDKTQSRAKPQAVAGDGSETCRVEVRPGKFMTLMRGDITKCRVDAIVNAANEDLKHIGGVAAAIADAAGPDLEEDCLSRIKLEGRLLPGQACMTRAGKLPCKKVIHAVGPRWNGGKKDEESTLAVAVESSLSAADKEGLKSIAMPSISTGIFNFPLDLATDIIVDAVKNYLVENSSTTVREVFFIDNDLRAVASLDKKLRTIQVDGPRDEAKKGRRMVAGPQDNRPSQDYSLPQDYSSSQNQRPPPNTNQRGSQGTRSPRFQLVSSGVIKTADGVTISLVKGSISVLQADVLVNTTGKELNLSHGNVSKSLLMAAGSSLQSEVDSNKPANFDYGQVVVTGGHRLKCKSVYHGSCRQWDNRAGGPCEQTVRTFMKNLLEKADADKHRSIAIPAIGTGNLRIPHNIVTEVMYSEVEKFSSQRKPMNLLDIRFIVYDKDRDSIKAFEDKISDLLSPGGSRGAAATAAGGSYAPSSRMVSSGASFTPSASASTSSSSGPDFSFDPGRKVIQIGTIEMTLKSGDITKERADAIVNSTNDRIDMTGGAVAKAILKAGGRAVEMECKRAKMSSRKVCVTSGGDLPAKYIIHLVAGHSAGEWKDVIANTLEEAEGRGFKSMVFPMLGTGQIGQSASLMASIMVDAVCEFYKTKRPRSLKEIIVCIFQPSMLDEFVDAVDSKGASRSFINRAAGAFGAISDWIGSKVHGRSNPQDDNNPVDDDEFSDDQAGAMQRTRTVAGPRQQIEEQHEEYPQHLSRIILSIYALSKKAIDEVLKDIEEVIKEYIIDKVLNSQQDQENIAKLHPEQVKRIKDMTNIFPVQIEVETGRLKRIRIRGPPMAVTSVMDQVHNIFQEAHTKHIKEKEEKWIATVAHWEYEDGTDYENYPDEINAIIEKAFRDKKPYAEWEEENAKYRLTFATMVEEFMTKAGTPPVKVRRAAKDMDIPANWEKMKNEEDLKRIPLNANDQEYKDVEKAARSTAQATLNQIVKIERIQNKLLYKQYVVRKAAMDAANPGVQNEMTLWHGTGADTLESINQSGFNRSYCGKNAVVYGRGVYFAKNFCYSAHNQYSPPDANGYKHIYQCKVLTGEYAVGNTAMIVPPANPGNAAKKYDSTVDNPTAPTIFVIFYDTQAFPEYLIYFK